MNNILVVDDEEYVRLALADGLGRMNYNVFTTDKGEKALKILEEEIIDLILLDIKFTKVSGLKLLEQIKKKWEEIPIIMISRLSEMDAVGQALKSGAYDYIQKPFELPGLNHKVQKALEKVTLRRTLQQKKEELRLLSGSDRLIGKSRVMRKVFAAMERLLKINATTLLLQGESGTGKDLVARAIHYNSMRAEKPFVRIDCAAIPDQLIESELFGHERGAFPNTRTKKIGLLEKADGGTILLDEIGHTRPDLQSKLLNTAETHRFRRVGGVREIFSDVRMIAVSKGNLLEKVKRGQFRENFYHRLMTFFLFLPPLRERKEDIPLLIEHFTETFNREYKKEVESFSEEALRILHQYDWPGNINELKNVIERVVIMKDKGVIQPVHLPFEIVSKVKRKEMEALKSRIMEREYSLEDIEKMVIARVLERSQGNISRAARSLKVSRDHIRYRVKKWNLRPKS